MQPTDTKEPVAAPLTLKEVAKILVHHYDLHEGLFETSFALQIAVGSVGPVESQSPGVAFAINGVGLVKAQVIGPNTVDAAEINSLTARQKVTPEKKRRKAAAA